MIAKCLVVVLAVAAEISAYKYNQDSYSKPEHPTCCSYSYCYQPTQISDKFDRVMTASPVKSSSQSQNQNVGYARPVNVAPLTRNLVARGKYPITLQSAGPAPDKKIPIVTSHLRAPVQEKPTVRLQAKIPSPKTIAHTCTCYKTIVKPRVQQHLISVPTIQRYIETFHRPVVENIHYEAYPVKCLESTEGEEKEKKTETFQVQPVELSAISGIQIQNDKNSGIQTLEIPRCFELPKAESEKSQVIEIPRIQFAEEQKPQTIEIPRIQFIQTKKPQTVQIELPRVQYVESQKSEGFEVPQAQFFDNKKPQFMEILNTQFVEQNNNNNNNNNGNNNKNSNSNNKPENVQLQGIEFLQPQKLQTIEIPRIQVEETPKVQTVQIPLGGTPFTYQFKN